MPSPYIINSKLKSFPNAQINAAKLARQDSTCTTANQRVLSSSRFTIPRVPAVPSVKVRFMITDSFRNNLSFHEKRPHKC